VSKERHPATSAARAGLGAPTSAEGVDLIAAPAVSSVRAYPDIDAVDAGMDTRDAYRRYGNESVRLLEEAIAGLETPSGMATVSARATSSGQAALSLALTLLSTPARRRVVVVRPCYGGTDALVAGPLGNLGVKLTAVDLPVDGAPDHAALVAPHLAGDVMAVVVEVITNPLMDVIDIPAIAAACHTAGVSCVVDATLATPFLFRPFAHGADLVFHSLTKHLSGHSDVLGGVLLVHPDHEAAAWLDPFARLIGTALGPFDAWLSLRGLRTGELRVQRASQNAQSLVTFFAARPEVAATFYPGRRGPEEEARAQRLLPLGRGPMLSVDVGSRDRANEFIRNLDGVRLAPSLGDVATTVSHPASTSHRSLTPQQQAALGITPGLVRVSAGIEHLDDLREEFDAALRAVG
jgi:cystathionine gamma-synthase